MSESILESLIEYKFPIPTLKDIEDNWWKSYFHQLYYKKWVSNEIKDFSFTMLNSVECFRWRFMFLLALKIEYIRKKALYKYILYKNKKSMK